MEETNILLSLIKNIEWLAVLNTAATIVLAICAIAALSKWKEEKRHELKLILLDDLNASVNECYHSLSGLNSEMWATSLQIKAYQNSKGGVDELYGIKEYIRQNGHFNSKIMSEKLNKFYVLQAKVQNQLNRGDILDFGEKYTRVRRNIELFISSEAPISAFNSIQGKRSLNLDNAECEENL